MRVNQLRFYRRDVAGVSNRHKLDAILLRMLLKRRMGNGEWGMGNGEWGGEWGMRNCGQR